MVTCKRRGLIDKLGPASMGPCLKRHGNETDEIIKCRCIAASMGPCLKRHGNEVTRARARARGGASMGPCLKRHGNVSTRTLMRRYSEIASMGPCLKRHGNIKPWLEKRWCIGLQWGHALKGMVTAFISRASHASKSTEISRAYFSY